MADALPATTAVTVDRGFPRRKLPFLRLQRDERLVALIRAGDDRAFETLFGRYRPRLLAFCRGMVGSAEDAEDVLQEVFAAAHRAMVADRREIAVKPWLYRIARNRCLNHLRRPTVEASEDLDSEPHENGTSTADRAESRDELRGLLEAVGELPETQRSALLLRELDALSYEEIARTLATTVPAVKSLLVRARMSLAVASQARELSCGEVQLELAEAAEGLRKASSPARHHLRHCRQCETYRTHLRSSARELGLLAPLGLLGIVRRLLGLKATGSGATAGGAGTGGFGSSMGATGGIGLAAGVKTIATVAVTTLLGAGASHVSGVGPPAGSHLPDAISAINSGPALLAAAPQPPGRTAVLEDRTVTREQRTPQADATNPGPAREPDSAPPTDEEASTPPENTQTTETPYATDPGEGDAGSSTGAEDGSDPSPLTRLGFSSPEGVRHWREMHTWGGNDEEDPPPPPPPPPDDPPDPPPPPDDGGPGSLGRGHGGET